MFDGEDDVDAAPILDCSRDLLTLQWVTFCQIVSAYFVTLSVYLRSCGSWLIVTFSYGQVVSKEDLVDLDVETFRLLRKWKRELPSQLQYDRKDKSAKVTPHVLLLQYI